MKKFKQKIKILSWMDIIIGAVFLILPLIGIPFCLLLPETPFSRIFELSLLFFIGLLMIISGYILIESKRKNFRIVGWVTSIFGSLNIISVIIDIFHFVEHEYPTIFYMITGLVLGIITCTLMIISGYYLRKLL